MTVMMTMMMTRFDRGLPILMMSLMMKIAPQNAPVLPLSICKAMCQNHGLSNNDSKKQLKNLLKIIRKVEKTSPAFSRQINPSTSFQIQPEWLSFLASPLRHVAPPPVPHIPLFKVLSQTQPFCKFLAHYDAALSQEFPKSSSVLAVLFACGLSPGWTAFTDF